MRFVLLGTAVILLGMSMAPSQTSADMQMTWGWADGRLSAISNDQLQYSTCAWSGRIQSPAIITIIAVTYGGTIHFYDAFTGNDIPGSPFVCPSAPTFIAILDSDGDGLDEVFVSAGNDCAMFEWVGPSPVEGDYDAPPDPIDPALGKNYPNPFNPKTTIQYSVPADSRVSLAIYDARGQLVKNLSDGHQATGAYTVSWDGTDSFGSRVASGTYFYQLVVGGEAQSKKMLVLK